jgi:VTC domain
VQVLGAQVFVRTTRKFWVRSEHVTTVKAFVLQHLPVFQFNQVGSVCESILSTPPATLPPPLASQQKQCSLSILNFYSIFILTGGAVCPCWRPASTVSHSLAIGLPSISCGGQCLAVCQGGAVAFGGAWLLLDRKDEEQRLGARDCGCRKTLRAMRSGSTLFIWTTAGWSSTTRGSKSDLTPSTCGCGEGLFTWFAFLWHA